MSLHREKVLSWNHRLQIPHLKGGMRGRQIVLNAACKNGHPRPVVCHRVDKNRRPIYTAKPCYPCLKEGDQ